MSENNFSKDYTDLRLIHASRYGNSRVFVANFNGKKVIVKALKEECANDAACRASLRQEYETTSMLDNKYIRKALDFVQIEGLGDCIIFEYIEGKSLAEHVRVGTLSEKQVKSILTEVCDGLNYLHRNGIVHSNLNPENILVTAADLRPKLIDLGIPETKQDADRELLIKEMEFVAPEIIKGEDIDSRADIYSIGKIMEFIGQRNITKQFHSVATHCTQFSKEQRFDTISDVRSAIAKGPSLVKIIIILAILALVGGLAYVFVPKIKANVEKEREKRMSVEFDREVEKIYGRSGELCKKYAMKSLDERLDWKEDSLKIASDLMQYLNKPETKDKAEEVLKQIRAEIVNSRAKDFDGMVLEAFKADTTTYERRSALGEVTDETLLKEAKNWYKERQK